MSQDDRSLVTQLWQAGVDAVGGEASVKRALAEDSLFQADFIIAVGKAACGMCLGALKNLPAPCPALVVTKYAHTDTQLHEFADVEILESAHPVPDNNSLEAGHRVRQAVQGLPADANLLLLVSGGASALTEALPDCYSLEQLQTLTNDMLSAGKTIAEINAARRELSLIKGGKLLEGFQGTQARAYIISDVEGDSIDVIASGTGASHLCSAPASSRVIAANHVARQRAEEEARELGYDVVLNQESLYQDVYELSEKIADKLKSGKPGIYIWGGEPTIVLPDNPGQGGRNQSLALALDLQLGDVSNVTAIVAGTDGSDGPTNAAGGIISGNTHANAAEANAYLLAADAGSYLDKVGDLFVSGPTNTNVMDLIVAIVR